MKNSKAFDRRFMSLFAELMCGLRRFWYAAITWRHTTAAKIIFDRVSCQMLLLHNITLIRSSARPDNNIQYTYILKCVCVRKRMKTRSERCCEKDNPWTAHNLVEPALTRLYQQKGIFAMCHFVLDVFSNAYRMIFSRCAFDITRWWSFWRLNNTWIFCAF